MGCFDPTIPAVIDSHCHLDGDRFGDDLPAVLERARAAGVTSMICVGSGQDLTSARDSVALANRETDVYATVGVHPHDVAGMTEADWTELGALAAEARVVGIGESGLDYYYEHSPRPAQQAAYRRFVALARRAGKALSSHVRDAHEDALAILRTESAGQVGGVVHCFSGNLDHARGYLDLGLDLSFSGILTFKTADEIRRVAAYAPLRSILVETDAPFLAPIPFRGKRNEPSFVLKTLETLAAVRGIPLSQAADATTENARRRFQLPEMMRLTP